jgi:hypothetical protein
LAQEKKIGPRKKKSKVILKILLFSVSPYFISKLTLTKLT